MIDIKHSQEINWKNETYYHSMNIYTSKEIKMIESDTTEKEESNSLSGFSDEETHKRKQRRYR